MLARLISKKENRFLKSGKMSQTRQPLNNERIRRLFSKIFIRIKIQ